MRVLWFCIPAYGHTNPTIEVVRELVGRGREVRYYSFEEFREKIEGAGADYVACDSYLPALDAKAERKLRKVSTTEMSVQSFRTVAALDIAEDDERVARLDAEHVARLLGNDNLPLGAYRRRPRSLALGYCHDVLL